MKAYLDCIPCIITQGLKTARLATADEDVHEQVVRTLVKELGEADWSATSMELGRIAQRVAQEATNCPDPYRAIREQSNAEALALYPRLRKTAAEADDPLQTAARIAIAGNIIDFGVASHVIDVEATLARVLNGSFAVDHYDRFARRLRGASSVLYLADNAGEIVFDRVLIEQMANADVTVAVKNEPFINDAMLSDAEAAGLTDLVDVIQVPIYPDTSEALQQAWASADLIVAKGQANYEAYSEAAGPLFFLLLAKCDLIARHVGVSKGDMILLDRRSRNT